MPRKRIAPQPSSRSHVNMKPNPISKCKKKLPKTEAEAFERGFNYSCQLYEETSKLDQRPLKRGGHTSGNAFID